MHYGMVNDAFRPGITLTLLSDDGATELADFIIDTGFSEEMTLPQDSIDRLGLPPIRDAVLFLADGRAENFPIYTGWVLWHDRLREIEVTSVESEPLIGMKLLQGSNRSVDATTTGGAVVITELAG